MPFLNGVTIVNSAFLYVTLINAKFDEAQLTKTSFVRFLLDGTDFVRATFSDVFLTIVILQTVMKVCGDLVGWHCRNLEQNSE